MDNVQILQKRHSLSALSTLTVNPMFCLTMRAMKIMSSLVALPTQAVDAELSLKVEVLKGVEKASMRDDAFVIFNETFYGIVESKRYSTELLKRICPKMMDYVTWSSYPEILTQKGIMKATSEIETEIDFEKLLSEFADAARSDLQGISGHSYAELLSSIDVEGQDPEMVITGPDPANPGHTLSKSVVMRARMRDLKYAMREEDPAHVAQAKILAKFKTYDSIAEFRDYLDRLSSSWKLAAFRSLSADDFEAAGAHELAEAIRAGNVSDEQVEAGLALIYLNLMYEETALSASEENSEEVRHVDIDCLSMSIELQEEMLMMFNYGTEEYTEAEAELKELENRLAIAIKERDLWAFTDLSTSEESE